jgi:hypothetical protein
MIWTVKGRYNTVTIFACSLINRAVTSFDWENNWISNENQIYRKTTCDVPDDDLSMPTWREHRIRNPSRPTPALARIRRSTTCVTRPRVAVTRRWSKLRFRRPRNLSITQLRDDQPINLVMDLARGVNFRHWQRKRIELTLSISSQFRLRCFNWFRTFCSYGKF